MCVCTRIHLFSLACYPLHPARCDKCVEVHSMQEVWVTGQTNPKHHEIWSAKENQLGHEFSFCLSLLTFCRWQWGSLYWPYTAAKSWYTPMQQGPAAITEKSPCSFLYRPTAAIHLWFSSAVVFTNDHSKLTILSLFAHSSIGTRFKTLYVGGLTNTNHKSFHLNIHFCECRFDSDKCACVDTPLDTRYLISFNGLCTICACGRG